MAQRSEDSSRVRQNATRNEDYEEAIADIRTTMKARADEKSGFAEKLADRLTIAFGSMPFLLLNCLWFALWIVINVGLFPAIPIFDPFPFGFLTMIVSLEAIILAIIVLISQNRAARIADLNSLCREGLAKIPRVTLHTPRDNQLAAGIICFEVAGMTPEAVVDKLLEQHIIASVTPYAKPYARIAFGIMNTPEEVTVVLQAIADLSGK